MEEKIGISAGELLENAFRILSEKNSYRRIGFPEQVSVIIAEDSDIHRARQGYMGYKSATLFEINKKLWAMSVGKAWGDYPADPYDSDILAIEISSPEEKIDKDLMGEIQKRIHFDEHFQHSLIIARKNGQITVAENPENRFKKKILESLRPVASKFIVQKLEIDKWSVSAIDLQPVVISMVRYKPEFAEVMANRILEILRKE
ncbi:MAG: hypothetical protein Q8N37_04720 [bacterium]|nr:hypothetical protein [bacterium]